MRVSVAMALLVAGTAVAGCLGAVDPGAAPDATTDPAADAVDWATVEQRPAVNVTFTVQARPTGPIDVAGYLWLPDRPVDTVLLLVPGGGGLARVTWGPAPVPGYSFVHRAVESGRAALVIDRPGYGASDDHSGDLDEQAEVIARIADQLRTGAYQRSAGGQAAFDDVVVVGHSIGAYLAMVAQGEHGAFDAIVPIGWSHRGLREGWLDCDDDIDCLLYPGNSDETLRAWLSVFLMENEGNPPLTMAMLAASTGAWRSADPGTGVFDPVPDREDLSAAKIDGPVLMVLGIEDGLVEPTTQEDEEDIFTSTDDVTVVRYEDTAHWIFHHLNRDEVYRTIFDWLDDRGL